MANGMNATFQSVSSILSWQSHHCSHDTNICMTSSESINTGNRIKLENVNKLGGGGIFSPVKAQHSQIYGAEYVSGILQQNTRSTTSNVVTAVNRLVYHDYVVTGTLQQRLQYKTGEFHFIKEEGHKYGQLVDESSEVTKKSEKFAISFEGPIEALTIGSREQFIMEDKIYDQSGTTTPTSVDENYGLPSNDSTITEETYRQWNLQPFDE